MVGVGRLVIDASVMIMDVIFALARLSIDSISFVRKVLETEKVVARQTPRRIPENTTMGI
jgi:uncharacterized membrane protein YsdA (DUF1294 family)